MFVTGPDVIKTVTHEEVTKQELGGAMTHNATSGVAHFAARDDAECLAMIRELLSFIPSNNLEDPPRRSSGASQDAPANRGAGTAGSRRSAHALRYEGRHRAVADDGYLFEVQEHFAKNLVIGFARLDARAVGIVANQPAVLAGVPGHRRLGEGRALCAILRRVQHSADHVSKTCPVFFRARSRNMAASLSMERNCCYAFAEATVPKITVITRKAYGGAYCVMASEAHSHRHRTSRGPALKSR